MAEIDMHTKEGVAASLLAAADCQTEAEYELLGLMADPAGDSREISSEEAGNGRLYWIGRDEDGEWIEWPDAKAVIHLRANAKGSYNHRWIR